MQTEAMGLLGTHFASTVRRRDESRSDPFPRFGRSANARPSFPVRVAPDPYGPLLIPCYLRKESLFQRVGKSALNTEFVREFGGKIATADMIDVIPS